MNGTLDSCYYGVQEKRLMRNLRQYEVPLHRYMAMMDLQVLADLHGDLINQDGKAY